MMTASICSTCYAVVPNLYRREHYERVHDITIPEWTDWLPFYKLQEVFLKENYDE